MMKILNPHRKVIISMYFFVYNLLVAKVTKQQYGVHMHSNGQVSLWHFLDAICKHQATFFDTRSSKLLCEIERDYLFQKTREFIRNKSSLHGVTF